MVFLLVSQIYGWRPDYYKPGDELPHDMPQSLKRHIGYLANSTDPSVRAKVSVEGETSQVDEFRVSEARECTANLRLTWATLLCVMLLTRRLARLTDLLKQ